MFVLNTTLIVRYTKFKIECEMIMYEIKLFGNSSWFLGVRYMSLFFKETMLRI